MKRARTTRRYDAQASHQEILEAAERLFADRGYGEVSTGEIARDAGVAQSQVHYHFGSKRELWRQVLSRRVGDYVAAQSDALARADVAGMDRLAQMIGAHFAFFRENPRLVKLLGRASLDGTSDADEAGAGLLMERCTQAIAGAQRAGEVRSDVPAEFILSGLVSLIAHWFQGRPPGVPADGAFTSAGDRDEQYLDFILKVYLKGITP